MNEEEKGGDEPEQPKPKEKAKGISTDGKKPLPTMIAGQGLTFAITISTKTLMLYQFPHHNNRRN